MYDPELVIQDADIEMAELEQAAAEEEAARRAGNCHHSWTGPAEDGRTNKYGGPEFECHHCKKRFASGYDRDKELGFLDEGTV